MTSTDSTVFDTARPPPPGRRLSQSARVALQSATAAFILRSAPMGYRRLEGGNPESATAAFILRSAPMGYRHLEGGSPSQLGWRYSQLQRLSFCARHRWGTAAWKAALPVSYSGVTVSYSGFHSALCPATPSQALCALKREIKNYPITDLCTDILALRTARLPPPGRRLSQSARAAFVLCSVPLQILCL